MNFGDAEFLAVFLPLAWALHWLLPRRASAQNALLLAASVLFFASWGPRLLAVLAVSTAAHLGLARAMRATADARRRRALLAVGITLSVAQLVVFKYLGFLADTASDLAGLAGVCVELHAPRLAMPVGLSFWTLQQISWLVDVHDERDPGDATALEYATWVAFFPRLVSGPIVRGSELLPQLREARGFDVEKLRRGVAMMFRGFVGKYLVAASVGALVVDPVFSAPSRYGAAAHWAALAGYAAQVYADFAGYSEMAQGCALLFGLDLPRNFDHPFFARSMLEFWRRWHVTLTGWLFDYVYSPMVTGTGRMRGRFDLGFLLVFAISGLWHGPTWAFVAWGALHGLALAVHRRWDEHYRSLCRKDRAWVARRKHPAYGLAAWAVTQSFFLVSLVPFRAGSFRGAAAFARGMVAPAGHDGIALSGARPALTLAASAALLLAWELLHTSRLDALRQRLAALPAPVRGLAYGLLVAWLAVFMPLTGAAFIYAQF